MVELASDDLDGVAQVMVDGPLAGLSVYVEDQSPVSVPVALATANDTIEVTTVDADGNELETYMISIEREPAAESAVVFGRVVSFEPGVAAELIEPVAGASVSIAGRAATTDVNGSFIIEEVPVGADVMQITADGYVGRLDHPSALPFGTHWEGEPLFVLTPVGAATSLAVGANSVSLDDRARLVVPDGSGSAASVTFTRDLTAGSAFGPTSFAVAVGGIPAQPAELRLTLEPELVDALGATVAVRMWDERSAAPTRAVAQVDAATGEFVVPLDPAAVSVSGFRQQELSSTRIIWVDPAESLGYRFRRTPRQDPERWEEFIPAALRPCPAPAGAHKVAHPVVWYPQTEADPGFWAAFGGMIPLIGLDLESLVTLWAGLDLPQHAVAETEVPADRELQPTQFITAQMTTEIREWVATPAFAILGGVGVLFSEMTVLGRTRTLMLDESARPVATITGRTGGAPETQPLERHRHCHIEGTWRTGNLYVHADGREANVNKVRFVEVGDEQWELEVESACGVARFEVVPHRSGGGPVTENWYSQSLDNVGDPLCPVRNPTDCLDHRRPYWVRSLLRSDGSLWNLWMVVSGGKGLVSVTVTVCAEAETKWDRVDE